MGITGITSGMTPNTNPGLNLPKIQADYDAMAAAIDNGDITTAQTGYNTLKADMLAGGKLPGSDLLAVANALQQGDISQAQQALSRLRANQQAIQTALNMKTGPDIEQLLFGDGSSNTDNTGSATASGSTDILDLSTQQTADQSQVSSTYTKQSDGSYLV